MLLNFFMDQKLTDTERLGRDYGIHIRSSYNKMYGSVYVEAIHGPGEFDGGPKSGWMFHVKGSYPGQGASNVRVRAGDSIQWRYSLDPGKDV